jgi:hypothetical protein
MSPRGWARARPSLAHALPEIAGEGVSDSNLIQPVTCQATVVASFSNGSRALRSTRQQGVPGQAGQANDESAIEHRPLSPLGYGRAK